MNKTIRVVLWLWLAAVSAFLIAGLVGCNKPTTQQPTATGPISRQTIQVYLFSQGVDPTFILAPDLNYSTVDSNWLSGTFSEALKADQATRGAWTYVNPENNCNKFTTGAKALANQLWFQAPRTGRALAFGQFWYLKDAGDAHAVNVAICPGPTLVFYEPQLRRVIPLSKSEVQHGCVIF